MVTVQHITYYIQQDGIKLSPEAYTIGKVGNTTEYFGVFARVSVEENGYVINLQRIPEISERESCHTASANNR